MSLKEYTREEYEAAKLTWTEDVSDLVGDKDDHMYSLWQERMELRDDLRAFLNKPYMKGLPSDPSHKGYIQYQLTRLYRWITWKNVDNAK